METASIATAAARGGVSVGVQQQQQQPTISKDVYKRYGYRRWHWRDARRTESLTPPHERCRTSWKVLRWVCVYPTYLNGARSIAEGRRVPREACPTNPTLRDIVETAAKLGLRMVVEVNKRHPRDPFTLGRVRVELKKEDGSLAGPIKSRAST